MNLLMKKIYIAAFVLLTAFFVSCKKESLQTFIVESHEKKGYVNMDIPISVLEIANDAISDDDKSAYESIRKINITGLPISNTDAETYTKEKETLQRILKKSTFKKLMNFKDKGMHVTVYYTGESNAIDEIVAFGYGDKYGVGIARLLGENMNPAKVIKMIQNTNIDEDKVNISQLSKFFEGK